MIEAPFPKNENERLLELYKYELLDTAYEKDFDEIVQLASKICNVPISTITLIDSNRQWFKAKVGMRDDQTSRDIAFCGHAILDDHLMEINDAKQDERFNDNPLVTGDPSIRFYAGYPLKTNNGFNVGTLCVIDRIPRDLDDEQRFALKVLANQVIKLMELRIRNKDLKHSTEVQNRIISIVAHDVRNPMASLKSILELKEQDIISNEEADEMLAISSKQLTATIEMVNNLVDWGKLQMKTRDPIRKETKVYEIIDTVIATAEVSFSLKNNTFNNQIPKDLVVVSDPQALQFILRNLITNANKFCENGTITVAAKKASGKINIMIADTGIGMSEEKANNLFSSHKNFATPGTQNEIGSGLGLVLIKEFLDKIDGIINVTSVEGRGTTFSIVLNG